MRRRQTQGDSICKNVWQLRSSANNAGFQPCSRDMAASSSKLRKELQHDDLKNASTSKTTTNILTLANPIQRQNAKMYAQRIAQRAAPAFARRAFSTTRVQRASPFHYPEGPRSNLPFNPLTKFFFVRYWLFMGMCRRGLRYQYSY